jgi:hypothetical protein
MDHKAWEITISSCDGISFALSCVCERECVRVLLAVCVWSRDKEDDHAHPCTQPIHPQRAHDHEKRLRICSRQRRRGTHIYTQREREREEEKEAEKQEKQRSKRGRCKCEAWPTSYFQGIIPTAAHDKASLQYFDHDNPTSARPSWTISATRDAESYSLVV